MSMTMSTNKGGKGQPVPGVSDSLRLTSSKGRRGRRSEMKKIMRLIDVLHVADTSDGYVQLFKLIFCA